MIRRKLVSLKIPTRQKISGQQVLAGPTRAVLVIITLYVYITMLSWLCIGM